jgi:two-component system nitrogen regulation response regulator NtrX
MRFLQAYPWPGNVRELRNLLERLVLMTPGPRITTDDLPESVRGAAASGMPTPASLEDARRAFEREYIVSKLREHAGNISRTAEAIGLARESLSRKMRQYRIEAQRD